VLEAAVLGGREGGREGGESSEMGIQEETIKQRAAAESMDRMTVAVKRNQCSKPLCRVGGREGGREVSHRSLSE